MIKICSFVAVRPHWSSVSCAVYVNPDVPVKKACHEDSPMFHGEYKPFFKFTDDNEQSVEVVTDLSVPDHFSNFHTRVSPVYPLSDADSDRGSPVPVPQSYLDILQTPDSPGSVISDAPSAPPTSKSTLVLEFGGQATPGFGTWGKLVATHLESLHDSTTFTSIDELGVVSDPKDHRDNALVYILVGYPSEPNEDHANCRFRLDHLLSKCADFKIYFDNIFVFMHASFDDEGLPIAFKRKGIQEYFEAIFTAQLLELFKKHKTHAFFSHAKGESFSDWDAYTTFFTHCTSVFDHTFFLPGDTIPKMQLAHPFILRVVSFLRDHCTSSSFTSLELGEAMWTLLDSAGYMAVLRWFCFIGTFRAPRFRKQRELRKYVYLPMWAERPIPVDDYVFLEEGALGVARHDLDPSCFTPLSMCPVCNKRPKWKQVEGPTVNKVVSRITFFQPFDITWFQCSLCGEMVQCHKPADLLLEMKCWYFEGFSRVPKVEGPGQWAVYSPFRDEDLKEMLEEMPIYKKVSGSDK
ncbi:hypothetical protein SCHPADRAFT_945775 [Schizopora paradoxa]|uniref:Uncharacterized protein n=1 Tax=Schizopora paradoxa TaxID=27342 RepID=A0A0H2R4N7_9AGAM|nr:hypothetical protein SCHPADRAFT_945775 [Schizopora paradoxa]